MSDQWRQPARTAVVRETLTAALHDLTVRLGRPVLDVVDVGGGTGGFAVPVAELGHRVTVVDPSPDALAALDRRAAETEVHPRVRAVQGDAAALAEVVGETSADGVLCHGVLEVVDEPAEAVHGLRTVLRPGGLASILVAQRHAAVLSRAVAGHLDDALQVLASSEGHWQADDPLPRRYDQTVVTRLLADAGLVVELIHGVRIFSDLVPGSVVNDPAGARALHELESAGATSVALRPIAAQLHVLASLR